MTTPVGTKRGRPPKLTDSQIFEAVQTAIGKHGPQALTLTKVAEQLGVSGPALSHRFGSKMGLLRAFARHQPPVLSAHLDSARGRHTDPLEDVVVALVDLAAWFGDHSSFANHLAMLAVDLGDEELRRHAHSLQECLRAFVVERLTAANVDQPAEQSELIISCWYGTLTTWAIRPHGALDDRIDRQLRLAMSLAAARRRDKPQTPPP